MLVSRPEQREVGRSFWKVRLVMKHAISIRLHENGQRAGVDRVELFKLLPLHRQGLSTLKTPARKPINHLYRSEAKSFC